MCEALVLSQVALELGITDSQLEGRMGEHGDPREDEADDTYVCPDCYKRDGTITVFGF